MKKILTDLDYGFDKKDVKSDSKIRFKYIVHTNRFADKGSTWEGDVVKVANPNEVKRFSSEFALAKLLEDAPAV